MSALNQWLIQRISAAVLALFLPWLVISLLWYPPRDHAAWLAWVGRPWVSLLLLFGLWVLLLHAWVGVRDILLDYVHPFALRLTLLSLTALGLLGCGLWGALLLISTLARVWGNP